MRVASARTRFFNGHDRVELLDGQIVSQPGPGPTHASVVKRLNRLFVQREVWLLDLKEHVVLTHRNPIDGEYADVGVRHRDTTISTGAPLDLEPYVSGIVG